MHKRLLSAAGMVVLVLLFPGSVRAAQIRDICTVKGVRSQQLIGYGLVVGLKGTGDKSRVTLKALKRFFERVGMTTSAADINARNAALVLVTTELPPFAEEGMRLDVTVSAVNDATSLKGGRLIATPLHGPDPAQVYARAQGTVSFMGSREPEHTTSAVIRDGAIVERSVTNIFVQGGTVQLVLKQSASALASEVAQTINLGQRLPVGTRIARPLNPGLVEISLPDHFRRRPVEFLSEILRYPVDVDLPARVVINEETGTVAINDTVRVAPAAVAVGDIFLVVGGNKAPGEHLQSKLVPLDEGADLQELVAALQRLRVTPRDVIAVIEQLVAVGALQAELVVE